MCVCVEGVVPRLIGVLLEDRMQDLLTGATTQIDSDLVVSLTGAELFQQPLSKRMYFNLNSFSSYLRCHSFLF